MHLQRGNSRPVPDRHVAHKLRRRRDQPCLRGTDKSDYHEASRQVWNYRERQEGNRKQDWKPDYRVLVLPTTSSAYACPS